MPDNTKLKILYIVTKSNFGGAQKYIYDLASNLPKNLFEPLVAFGGNGPLKDKLETAGIPTISIPALERDIGILKEFRAFAHILKIIWEIRPDLVHLNSSKVGALGALAVRACSLFSLLGPKAYRLKPKVVFTAHGWAFKEKRKTVTRKIIGYISWFTVLLSHRTIVVSRDDLEKVEKFLFVGKKIKVIYNGIDRQVFLERNAARKILSEKTGWDASGFWVGTVAELHKNKGLDYALRAFASVLRDKKGQKDLPNNLFYTVIGEGEERQNLEKTVEQEGLSKNVALVGKCENAARLLPAFDIFLLPSLKEGLPYAILEAGCAGLPSIATNVGGIPEIVEDMKSGIIIKEKRPKEIEEVIKFLIDHPEKRKEFGEQLQKTVAENFTLERMVKETISVYTKL